jgi:hypothetical protein
MGLHLLFFSPTGILEQSDASLIRTICRRCCHSRTCSLHTQSQSPRSGIGPRHQLYAALSGQTSKGKKRDKVEARGFLCSSSKVTIRYLHQDPNPKLSTQLRTTWHPRAPVSISYLHLWSMQELPLLAPQWLQSDPRGRGSHSPLPDYNHDSPHSQLLGEVEIPKHEGKAIKGHVHDWGRGYRYRSNNSAERVHLYRTRDGTRRWSANWAHPNVWTLGSYGSILLPTLKSIPPRKGLH